MKLTETAMLRGYLHILKENENRADFEQKMLTIQDIAAKHSNEILKTQLLGVLGIPLAREAQQSDRIEQFVEQIRNQNIDFVDDMSTALGIVRALGGFDVNHLNAEQRKVFRDLTGAGSNRSDSNHINPEIVKKATLKSFKTGNLSNTEWLTMVSNMKSKSGTTRVAPYSVKQKLEDVGVEVGAEKTDQQKRRSMDVGKKSTTRIKPGQAAGKTPTQLIKMSILKNLSKTSETAEQARQVLDNLFTERNRNIIDAVNAVNQKLGEKKYSAQEIADRPYIGGPRVGRSTLEGLPPELRAEMKQDFKDYMKDGIPMWVNMSPEQSDLLQSNYAKSKQYLPKALASLGINPDPSMW